MYMYMYERFSTSKVEFSYMYMYMYNTTTRIYMYMYSTNQMEGIRLMQFTRVCTRRQTHLYTETNTCLYTVKWVYTRRQTRSHEKANAFALYLASDLYCTCTRMYNGDLRRYSTSSPAHLPVRLSEERGAVV